MKQINYTGQAVTLLLVMFVLLSVTQKFNKKTLNGKVYIGGTLETPYLWGVVCMHNEC